MNAANEVQIGGTHYRSAYQHWDWVTNTGQSYLASCVSKYLVRWRTKDGVESLRKAAHFCDKLIECAPILISARANLNNEWLHTETFRFIEINSIPPEEAGICFILAQWTSRDELIIARKAITTLININTDINDHPIDNNPDGYISPTPPTTT